LNGNADLNATGIGRTENSALETLRGGRFGDRIGIRLRDADV